MNGAWVRFSAWLRSLPTLGRVSVLAAFVAIVLQIAYPLASDTMQRVLTIASVCTFFVASLTHAAFTRGVKAAVALVVVCVGGGLVAESIGWRTGVPFGNYRYGDSLGVKLGGVPLVVALAWAMMGWIALLAGRRATSRLRPRKSVVGLVVVAVTGALVLVTWDLFLDPQMVDAGHWVWNPTPGPRLHGVPVVNSLGWFVVGAFMVLLLHLAVPRSLRAASADLPMWVLLGWTWFSETLGHIVFFGRPSVGVVGGLAMGAVLVFVCRPELAQLSRGRSG